MTETLVQLTAADFDEAIDFLNLVFGMYQPHDFVNLLPALYRPTDEHMGHNLAIRRHGRIAAIVGMFPISWHVGGRVLRLAGIGGVSTHARWRSGGLMRALMEECLRRMQADGCEASWLGGLRQRYRHFGYEVCGHHLAFTLSKRNATAAGMAPPIRFEPLVDGDPARIAMAATLHEAQTARCVRLRQDFPLYLRNWHHKAQAALGDHGKMLAYLVTNGKGDYVPEVAAETPAVAFEVLRAWALQREGGDISIEVAPHEVELARRLGVWAEHVQVRPAANWQILQWQPLLGAMLALQQSCRPLPEGSVVIRPGASRPLRLSVRDGHATCTPTDDRPDVDAETSTLMRALFGPLRPSQVIPLPGAACALEGWCPLPLYLPRQDTV